ncbi:glycosyltransferase [Flavivirga aquimarina]|uniref:Glycosyltransferase n=1 Tax=Flavivirga aquimarina TaxID=2027862 RepID=A0ABT8WDG4_9FLAO|nr:glycosyltransferase [Flavivirga aquimarina]MDO5971189.1 glycosyltransferase [Flavivirga aquimarina]
MKLSVIIPVYNVEKYIRTCLDSILNQGLEPSDYEIILINDGSKDNSVSIIKTYLENCPNMALYNQKNKGLGATRNEGIKLAKGDYIYFIDSDDYLAKNVLKTILLHGYKYDLDVITFNSTVTPLFDLDESNTNNDEAFSLNTMHGIDYIGHVGFRNEAWWYIIKRGYLSEIGITFVEGRFLEDAIFTASLLIKSKTIAHIPIDAHRYFKRENSIMTSKSSSNKLKMIYDMEDVVIKYKPLIESIPVTVENKLCIERLKSRQQSYVFFMMVRILKSTIKLAEIKVIINNIAKIKVYPLKSFIGKDYNGIVYLLITNFFNVKYLYYLAFLLINPFYRIKKFL